MDKNDKYEVSLYLGKIRGSLYKKIEYSTEERDYEFAQIVRENFINAMVSIKHKDNNLYNELMKEFYHELPI